MRVSTDFSVPIELPFPAGILTPSLPDLRWQGDPPSDPVTAPGTWHPYRDRISTRKLTVCWSGGELEVTLPAASAPEDLDLALTILRAAADHAGAEVATLYGPLAPDRLHDMFDEQWALHQLGRSVSMVARLPIRYTRLDDGNHLVEFTPEDVWPEVVAADGDITTHRRRAHRGTRD